MDTPTAPADLPGFKHCTTLSLTAGMAKLLAAAPSTGTGLAIYAFVPSAGEYAGRTMYVGSADNLPSRLRAYRKKQDRVEEHLRPVHQALNQALVFGPVHIFALPITERIEVFRGLPVDMLLGVEHGLIRTINPPWNRRGAKKLLEIPGSCPTVLE